MDEMGVSDYQEASARGPAPPSRRRWLQFRLKWLLLLITFLAVPFSWLGWKLEEKRRERWADGELSKFSVYLIEATDDPFEATDDPFAERERPGPAWLRRILDDDFFEHVTTVASRPSKLDPDVDLEEMSGPMLEVMSDDPPLTDAQLHYLRYLPRLRELSLKGAEVTDAGLTQLYFLTRLERLNLTGTKVSSSGVAKLRKAIPRCDIVHESIPKSDE